MNKKEKHLLISLRRKFVDKYGDNIAIVTKMRFTAEEKEKLTYQNLGAHGYVTSMNGSIFQLTKEGFIAAQEAAHPIRAFAKNNSKWVFTTIVLGVIMPILLLVLSELIKCSESESMLNLHPSELSTVKDSNKSGDGQ